MSQRLVRTAQHEAKTILSLPPSRLFARVGAVLASVVLAAQLAGCAQYQLRSPSSDPVDLQYREVTSHAFFWGLVYDPEIQTADGIDGINDVIVVDNLGYDILSVVTLGIWKPMTIRYRLRAPLDAPSVEFPVPADLPADPSVEHR